MNRLKPIDISIISARMGRIQTAVVTSLVIAIAVHAWVTRESVRDNVPLTVAVVGEVTPFEPLARLVSRRTARVTALEPAPRAPHAELFVMPSLDFMARRDELGLEGLFALGAAAGDRAVVVAAPERVGPPRRVDEVLFTAPHSVNGCWVQLAALVEHARVPDSVDSLRFAPGGDPARVVWAVEAGEVAYGACRASDLRRGAGLAVVLQEAAVPEWIVASRPDDASYFVERLGSLTDVFVDPSAHPSERDLVELLAARGVGSFRFLSPAQRAQLDEAFDVMRRVKRLRGSDSAGSP